MSSVDQRFIINCHERNIYCERVKFDTELLEEF